MYKAKKLDSGDVITREKLPINLSDHVGTLHDKLSEIGAKLLIDTLPSIFAGTNERIKQDETKATYAPNITREQEKINWEKTNETIYNQIRGLHPWPVAYTLFQGKRMKIWWGEKDDKRYDGAVGEIVSVTEDAFTVRCGDGKGIRITEVQPSGKKRMTVKEFLRGNQEAVRIGERLDS